jgi:hypothetical protein
MGTSEGKFRAWRVVGQFEADVGYGDPVLCGALLLRGLFCQVRILASIAAFLTASMPFSARLVGHKTLHSGNGIVRLDSHTH